MVPPSNPKSEGRHFAACTKNTHKKGWSILHHLHHFAVARVSRSSLFTALSPFPGGATRSKPPCMQYLHAGGSPLHACSTFMHAAPFMHAVQSCRGLSQGKSRGHISPSPTGFVYAPHWCVEQPEQQEEEDMGTAGAGGAAGEGRGGSSRRQEKDEEAAAGGRRRTRRQQKKDEEAAGGSSSSSRRQQQQQEEGGGSRRQQTAGGSSRQ